MNRILKFNLVATFLFSTLLLQAQEPVTGLQIGNKAPELTYPNPQGELVKLSSLKGKLVLIDFWASWCGPCRHENNTLTAAYHEYKEKTFKSAKGFTIFSVSLDVKKDAWIKAIADDKLIWPYHVSDLGGWRSKPAIDYQIRSIPSNFLIDANGTIIAKNIRGEALIETLRSLIK